MVTTFGEEITTIDGNLIETEIIEKFGKNATLTNIIRNFGGLKYVDKYMFKIQ